MYLYKEEAKFQKTNTKSTRTEYYLYSIIYPSENYTKII